MKKNNTEKNPTKTTRKKVFCVVHSKTCMDREHFSVGGGGSTLKDNCVCYWGVGVSKVYFR